MGLKLQGTARLLQLQDYSDIASSPDPLLVFLNVTPAMHGDELEQFLLHVTIIAACSHRL